MCVLTENCPYLKNGEIIIRPRLLGFTNRKMSHALSDKIEIIDLGLP